MKQKTGRKKVNAKERRKHFRALIYMPIRFIKAGKGSGGGKKDLDSDGIILDISSGGVKLHASEEMKKGDCVEMEVPLAGMPDNYRFSGRVRWVEQRASYSAKTTHIGGICFMKVDKKVQKFLKEKLSEIEKTVQEGTLI